jgi:AAA+ ATPase superfamily predicted ATPase
MAFYDRAEELALLNERWEAASAQLIVVWGRRRVGKTELLAEFLRTRRGVLFEATAGTEADQLADLARVLGQTAEGPLVGAQPFTSWNAVFAALEELCRSGPLAVVIDEFQYLAAASPSLGSLLSAWWGSAGRRLPLFLVLAGSAVSFFERDVLGQSSPLYGRRTGQIELLPFDYRDASLFFPAYGAEDRIRAYAVCGGIPYYLEQFDPSVPVLDNIRSSVLSRFGVLREEARLLLFEELPDPRTYFSVLRALAGGDTRVSQIANRAGLNASDVTKYLDVLQTLKIVRRLVPVGTTTRARTRMTAYEIADAYLRFWFRFVLPFEDRLVRAESIDRHLAETVAPSFDAFVSKPTFEEVARQFLLLATDAAEVGPWWGQVPTGVGRQTEQREIDCVALSAERRVLAVGTCKWTTAPMDLSEERLLSRLQPHVMGGEDARIPHFFFSRSGFSPDLLALAASDSDHYRLMTPEDLFSEIVRL